MIEIGCPGSVQSIVRENIRRENSNLKDDKRGLEILALIIAKEADSLFFLLLLLTPFLPCFFSSSFVCSFCVTKQSTTQNFKQLVVARYNSEFDAVWGNELVSTSSTLLGLQFKWAVWSAMNSIKDWIWVRASLLPEKNTE